jgi:hypothetical protein
MVEPLCVIDDARHWLARGGFREQRQAGQADEERRHAAL